jgi:hypothetical protein
VRERERERETKRERETERERRERREREREENKEIDGNTLYGTCEEDEVCRCGCGWASGERFCACVFMLA